MGRHPQEGLTTTDDAASQKMSRHRLAAVLPDLSMEERAALAESVRREGLRDAIWLHEGEVLDGWHRLLACWEAGVDPRFRDYDGGSPAHFVISMHHGRRNLDASQKAAIAAALEPALAAEARERMREMGGVGGRKRKGRARLHDPSRDPDAGLPATPPTGTSGKRRVPGGRDHGREKEGRSDVRAARLLGVSSRYVAEVKRIEREDPALAAKVRNGEVGIPGAVRLLRQREASNRKLTEAAEKVAAPSHEPALYLADFRDVELAAGSVDAIITDPPYPREFISLYDDLAEYASRVLKPGGVVAAMAGHIYLPQLHQLMGRHLDYVWTLCCAMHGASATVWPRRAKVGWKPILLYARGRYEGPTYYDRISSGMDREYVKDFHEWGQSEDVYLELIERFTQPGDLVLDPFLGGGTTGVAAIAAKRRFVGVEIDSGAYEAARRRMADARPNARVA